jgi:CheY-like chemotaxis protein
MKVMIVDDTELALNLLGRIVASLGHEVILRSESLGTLSEVRRLRPDVVLLDLQMPGLRGDALGELIARPQADGYAPVVAFMSGAEPEAIEGALKRAAARAALTKGSPGEMRRQLEQLLTRIAAERATG